MRISSRPPIFLFEINELLEIFGFFLLILICLELLESIRIYLIEGALHVQIVLEVALIARLPAR
ncbi:MAG: phosphate-starvation-inducible PsiE family protein [Desulfobacterales bacterium]|nr:phosphate-starvation-inducible PsiE family protein [Desulfobacterales bacterium]